MLIKWVEWPGLAIAGARSLITLPLLYWYLGRPKFIWTREQIGAAIMYAITVSLFVMATKLTTAANAILLHKSPPV